MDYSDIGYFLEGLSEVLTDFYGELYQALVTKGRRRMGQEDAGESVQVSELIRRAREKQAAAGLVALGRKGHEELVADIGGEVKRVLSSSGIVTRADMARIEKRLDEIEKAVEARGE